MEASGTAVTTNERPAPQLDFVAQATRFEHSTELQIRVQEAQTEIVTLTKGKALVIRDKTTEDEALRLDVILKEQLDMAEKERVAAKAPILEAGKIIDAKTKVFSATISGGREVLANALKEWDTHQTAVAQAAQDKLNDEARKKQEAENKRAEKKGVEPKQVAPAAVVQTPQKSTTVQVGGRTVTRTWVDNWKAKLTGVPDHVPVNAERMAELGIPARFFVLDRGLLNDEAKRMKCEDPIPGSKVIGWNDRYQR